MKNWILKSTPDIPREIKALKLNPVTLQLLVQRGFFSSEKIKQFFSTNYSDLHSPEGLDGIAAAVKLIGIALKKKEAVTIFGDYDADGITSTILLKEALGEIGISASTYIPDRNNEGYGLNKKALDFIKQKYKTQLLITVDCGTSNIEEVRYAKKIGLKVIVTDHHAIPGKLPKDCVIINPKMPGQKYEFQELAGVGVAFKLASALWQIYLPEKIEQLKWFLDIVAIGTVADCVPLIDENRVFAKFGLMVLQKTKRIGIQELIKVARLNINEETPPTAENIAFHIGPRFNAAGRVDHADLTLNLLGETDRVEARIKALELEAKNTERQKVTERVYVEAKSGLENAQNCKLIIRSGKNWPLGVVGVVAGKIASEFSVPTFILRDSGKLLEGSGRSIDSFDLIQAVSKLDKHLEKFGGHAQAMGLKLKPKNLQIFEKGLLEIINLEYNEDDWGGKIHVDMEIDIERIDWDLVSEIRKFEPFGEGNEEPVFITHDFLVDSLKIVGNGNKHVKLILRSKKIPNKKFEAIYFKGAEYASEIRIGAAISLIYNLRSNEWNGSHKIELRIISIPNFSKI